MSNKKTIIFIILILATILITNYVSIKITKFFASVEIHEEYKNLGLEIEDSEIEYCTVYEKDIFGEYKVYKIKNYYYDSMDIFKNQLENSDLWNKNKFYEYVMSNFYEIKEKETIKIDRENLYYYDKNGIYAIFDLKNAKLYYFKNAILNIDRDYIDIVGSVDDYTDKEVYSVRGGGQGDGTDYYTYEFNKEKGEKIENILNENQSWSKEKLAEDIIDCFEYNEEVYSIENGYYYYKKICRTSDEEKKNNFTDEEATGYEVGIYNIDTDKLYYYWTSF